MVIFLLCLIAVGVLLISEPGRSLLTAGVGIIVAFGIGAVVVVGMVFGATLLWEHDPHLVTSAIGPMAFAFVIGGISLGIQAINKRK